MTVIGSPFAMGASVAVAARGQEQPQSRVVVALEATVERATGLSAVYYTQDYALPNMSMTQPLIPKLHHSWKNADKYWEIYI